MMKRFPRFRLLIVVVVALLAACGPATMTTPKVTLPSTETVLPTAKLTFTPPIATPLPTATPQPTSPPITMPRQVLPYTLTWDPSARWLAYATNDGQVWLQARDGTPRPLSDVRIAGPGSLTPVWSPAGDRLLIYGSWEVEYRRWTVLWLVPVTTDRAGPAQAIVPVTEVTPPVYQNEGIIYRAAWSPDATRIAYSFQGEAWVHDLTTSQTQRLTHLTEEPLPRPDVIDPDQFFSGVRGIAWSPTGDCLALELTCNCPSPWSGVAVVGIDGQDVRLLADGGVDAAWSPDGRWVSFRNTSGDWGPGMTYDYYAIEPDTGILINLTRSNPAWDPLQSPRAAYQDAPYQTANLRWRPDGHYLYEVLEFSQGREMPPRRGFIVRADSETVLAEHLADDEAWYCFPAWLSDGRYAYLEVEPGSAWGTVRMRRAVIEKMPVLTHSSEIAAAAWAPDGAALALVVRAEALPDQVVILSVPSDRTVTLRVDWVLSPSTEFTLYFRTFCSDWPMPPEEIPISCGFTEIRPDSCPILQTRMK